MKDSIGSLLAQNFEDKTKRVIYYLSRLLLDVKTRYAPIEKIMFIIISCMYQIGVLYFIEGGIGSLQIRYCEIFIESANVVRQVDEVGN